MEFVHNKGESDKHDLDSSTPWLLCYHDLEAGPKTENNASEAILGVSIQRASNCNQKLDLHSKQLWALFDVIEVVFI